MDIKMNMKGGKVALLLAIGVLAIIIFLNPANAGTWTGAVDGYVKWDNGTGISGATVVVTVSGCSGGAGNGCTGTSVTQADGYYIVNNLNMVQGSIFSGIATSGSSTGCPASAVAGGGGVYIGYNITMCPSAPSQTPEPDTHLTSVTLEWTSGSDPGASIALYDQYQFDGGGYSNQTSPQTESGLSYAAHTWNVKTCNSQCCSCTPASDTFSVTNNPPPAPILNEIDSVNTSTVLLNWSSGGADPDGDAVHYEYQFGELGYWNITDDSNATSPKNESIYNGKTYNWRVRACDNTSASNSCSSWATDQFTVCNSVCAPCPSCPPCGGGREARVVTTTENYVASVSAPTEVSKGEDFVIFANYKSSSYTDSVTLTVQGTSSMSFTPVTITNLTANTEKTVSIKAKVLENATQGDYVLTFKALQEDTEILSKHFTISVIGAGPTAIKVIKGAPVYPIWIMLVLITATIIITALVARYRNKKAELKKYIKAKIRRGERPQRIYQKLRSLGYMESTLSEVFRDVGIKVKKLKNGAFRFYKIKKIKK